MIEIQQLADIYRLFVRLTDATPSDELFRVPTGFRNHIAWNAAHVVCAQQLLHYGLSGLPTHLPMELIERYRKGTGPETADEASFRAVMEFAPRAPRLLADDYAAGRFNSHDTYETAAGITLSNIDEAIAFNQFRAGLHLGYILAQRKALAA